VTAFAHFLSTSPLLPDPCTYRLTDTTVGFSDLVNPPVRVSSSIESLVSSLLIYLFHLGAFAHFDSTSPLLTNALSYRFTDTCIVFSTHINPQTEQD
jgi:hypothetical protein